MAAVGLAMGDSRGERVENPNCFADNKYDSWMLRCEVKMRQTTKKDHNRLVVSHFSIIVFWRFGDNVLSELDELNCQERQIKLPRTTLSGNKWLQHYSF